MARKPRDWSAEAAQTIEDREDALREYSTSLMSNAKWRKLIEAFSPLDGPALTCIVKFIGVSEQRTMRIPHANDLRGLSYLDSEFGPFRLKTIEWLETSRTVIRRRYEGDPGLEVTQDVAALERAIESRGPFPTEKTERGLKIVGHVPRR